MFDFNVGVAGCGNIAIKHLQYIGKRIPKDRLALCDLNSRRLHWLAQDQGIRQVYSNFQEMLEKFQPQVVHITTPPQTHKSLAISALEAGCHLFIEKPLAMSAQEARTIFDTSRQVKRLVCVNHMRIADQHLQRAQKLLETGRYGEVVSLSVVLADNYLERRKAGLAPAWLQNLPGEIFFDLMPHLLSIMGMFLPEAELKGVVPVINEEEELVNLLCTFSDGRRIGEIKLSVVAYPLASYVVLNCQRGSILIDFGNNVFLAQAKSELPSVVEQVVGNFKHGWQVALGVPKNILSFLMGRYDSYAGMDRLIAQFYQAIATDGESPASGEKGPAAIEMLEGIFQQVPMTKPVRQPAQTSKLAEADILVTGGTGFIGQPLVQRLVAQGHRVRVLTRRKLDESAIEKYPANKIAFVQADITDPEGLTRACEGIKTVYHLAAATQGNWFQHLDASVTGTENILEACCRSGVEHLVYASTISLLHQGRYPHHAAINEDFPYEPNPGKRGNYTYSKLLAERVITDYLEKPHNLTVTVIRPGLVYGPGKDPMAGLGMRLGDFILIFGSGKKLVPWVYTENLIDALLLAAATKQEGIYNVVDQETVTVKDTITLYQRLTRQSVRPLYVPKSVLLGLASLADGLFYLLQGKSPGLFYKFNAVCKGVVHSTSRIQQDLGWQSRIPFSEGLRQTLEFRL